MAKTDDDVDDRRVKKKKKKKKAKGGFPIVLVLVIALAVLLLGGGGAGLTYVLTRPKAEPQAKADHKPPDMPPPMPPGKLGGDVVKNPKTTLGNIRARANETERDAEMRGIVALYHAYCDEVRNPAGRNLDGFLQSIRSEPAKIVNGVRNKEYLVNYKAKPSGDDIVVYESERYDKGYFVFRANNQSGYVSAQDLTAAGLAAP
jgi:hypothetical protein